MAANGLAARRLELVQRAASERQQLREHTRVIQATIGGLAEGFSPARWLGASPLLIAGSVVLTLVLGRGRVLRTLGTGAAVIGLLRRYRSTFQLIGELVRQLAEDQAVRRSR